MVVLLKIHGLFKKRKMTGLAVSPKGKSDSALQALQTVRESQLRMRMSCDIHKEYANPV